MSKVEVVVGAYKWLWDCSPPKSHDFNKTMLRFSYLVHWVEGPDVGGVRFSSILMYKYILLEVDSLGLQIKILGRRRTFGDLSNGSVPYETIVLPVFPG